MRQVSVEVSYRFFLQAYGLILASEVLFALINPTYVQLFFDRHSPFVTAYHNEHQLSMLYGLFMMCSQIAGLCANIFWGWASDKIGRKPVAALAFIAVFIVALGAVWGANSRLLILFISGYILGQLLYGMFPVVIASVSSAAYHSRKKLLWIGLLQFFTGLAFVIGPYLGGLAMAKTHSFIAPYYLLLYVSLPVMLLIVRYYRPNRYYTQPKVNVLKAAVFNGLWQKKILILIILLLFDQVAWGIFFQFIQPIVKLDFGLSVTEIGFFVSFIGMALMCSSLVLLPILQKFMSHHALYILALLSMIFGCLGVAALSLLETHRYSALIYPLTFLVAFGDVVVFSLLVVGFSNAVPANRQGFIAGLLYTLAKGFGWGVAGVIGGIFMATSSPFVMGSAAMILALCLAFYLVVSPTIHRRS